MDSLFGSLQRLQQRLLEDGIQSAAIGALALAVWGQPRLTTDIDLKILLTREESQRLLDCLKEDYVPLLQRDPAAMLKDNGMLFVRDADDQRVDLLLSDIEFDREAIRRGRVLEVRPGVRVRVCSPEDLVIYKLISTRARDHDDARNVIRRQDVSLDGAYVRHWLAEFEAALDDSTLLEAYRSMGGR